MTTLGKYELHEQLGRGGFGTVYRAVDTTLGREVALKVLHPQLTTDPDFLERFRNEAKLVASLHSPNIVTIYELAEGDGRVFIAMEYLSGGSLKERLEKGGAIPFDETVKIMQQVCAGLAAAHKKDLVHRDIKPGNILFDSEGRAVLGDFGLARAIQLSSLSSSSSTGGVGTPAYRAPELWLGKPPANSATDIYSLGCVLSEMLIGKVLFDGDTTEEILAKHLITGPNIPETYPANVPNGIRSVIEKAVVKDSKERYQTVDELEQAIEGLSLEGKERENFAKVLPPTHPIPVPVKPTGSWLTRVTSLRNHAVLWLGIAGLVIIGLIITLVNLGIEGSAAMTTDKSPTSTQPPTSTKSPIPSQVRLSTATATATVQISPIDGMELMYIPFGSFLMGSEDNIGGAEEHPQFTVTLDAYWIDKMEVTNAMYAKCVTAGACTKPSSYSSSTRSSYYGNQTYNDYPVVFVNWDQANAYCVWAGRGLPTEAQWEKAARGINGRIYPWGNQSPDPSLANFNSKDTTKVASYKAGASPYGAFDMAGNVWEWVADKYDPSYYQNDVLSNPIGPDSGDDRVIRGGSWNLSADDIRAAYRKGINPSITNGDIGFRCAFGSAISGLPTETVRPKPMYSFTKTPEPTATSAPVSPVHRTPKPTSSPTETPTDVTTEIPTDVTTEIPTDVTTEVPTDVTTEVPTDVTTEVPTTGAVFSNSFFGAGNYDMYLQEFHHMIVQYIDKIGWQL